MGLFDEKTKKAISNMLQNMFNKVKLVYFTQEFECNICKDTRIFLEEISTLSNKITLEVHNFLDAEDKAKELKVDKIPAVVLLDENNKNTGIKFYGIPAGFEINSFLNAILEVSGKKKDLPVDLLNRIKSINKDIHIQVFVTLTCPYCPMAVINAHRLALENDKIHADMIDSTIFTTLAIKYSISAVPQTIINDKYTLLGAQPIEKIIELIEKV